MFGRVESKLKVFLSFSGSLSEVPLAARSSSGSSGSGRTVVDYDSNQIGNQHSVVIGGSILGTASNPACFHHNNVRFQHRYTAVCVSCSRYMLMMMVMMMMLLRCRVEGVSPP